MSKKPLVHWAQRILNTPVAILPSKGEVIFSVLSERLLGVAMRDGDEDDYGGYDQADPSQDYGYDTIEECAIIQVHGTLVHKNGYLRPSSGMTGYDGIRQNFLHALDNPKVKAIVLDIDSGGGEVSGCFDLVDTIYEARGQKTIAAILNESAYSAAYAIASAADIITVPKTGGTGSIGVICMHVDYSRALDQAGMKPTLIQFGEKKSYGTGIAPLSKDALAAAQQDVDMMGEMFVELVARNRGLSADKVRASQAGTFLGQEGVDFGLADELLSPHLAFTKLLNTIN